MGLTKGYQARILKLNSLDAHLAIKLLKKSTWTFKPCIHSENNHNVLQFSVPLSVEEKKMNYMEKCNEANLYIWILHIRFSRCKKGKKKKKMSITFCHSLCHCLLLRENVRYVGKCNEALHMNINHIQSRPTYCISILGSSWA